MDSKPLFVLKAKTLERLGAFVCLKKFACCGQASSSTFCSSLRLPTSQTCCKLKKNSTEFPQQMVDILFNGLKEPVKVIGSNCSASSLGLVICSF